MTSSGIKSVNWHLISTCNYSCKFCFARNLGERPVRFEQGEEIIAALADLGMEKINFAGGEPLLHPRLIDYCRTAQRHGMVVSITTNGSLLTKSLIDKMATCADWLALSIDSGSDEVERQLGRGNGSHVSHCIAIADLIHAADIHLKVNTTVTRLTFREKMDGVIDRLNPERWKVLQMLHIIGENDKAVPTLSVTDQDFAQFVRNHRHIKLRNGSSPVFEKCSDIEGSYFMITPGGNVKIDSGRMITIYPLYDVTIRGIEHFVDVKKYLDRGALYKWRTLIPSPDNTNKVRNGVPKLRSA